MRFEYIVDGIKTMDYGCCWDIDYTSGFMGLFWVFGQADK